MMSAQLQKSGTAQGQDGAGQAQSQHASDATAANAPFDSTAPMTNRAASSRSPFIRAHSDSVVAWQLLDQETLARAKAENKLIFLTIGYLASHYCHLTRQDSFSHPKIASVLNQHFIPTIVDREERPDLDSIYMNYIHSLNNSGGWPLNVFLTPELEPVFGGTYWEAPGAQPRPSASLSPSSTSAATVDGSDEPLEFAVVLKKLQDVWPTEEARVRDEAKKSVIELRQFSPEGTLTAASSDEIDLDQIEEAYTRIAGTFDPMFGGFGDKPKFPTPAKLSLLLRATRFPREVRDVVGAKDCEYVSTMALHTLRRLVTGGMHDHIGGGFHRHSITRDWSLPSFEKLLTDNALLLAVFLDAWLLLGGTQDGEFYDTVVELADYITGDVLTSDTGAFVTSEAADSFNRKGDTVMKQGAYYLWTRKSFDAVVGDEQESDVAAAYWDVKEHGNVDHEHDPNDEFLNQNVLRIVRNYARLGKQLGVPEQEVKTLIESAKSKLQRHRQNERVHPNVDTKIVTAYNGMAIGALARTAAALRYTDDSDAGSSESSVSPRKLGEKYLAAAERAVEFVLKELWDESTSTLYRVYADGARAPTPAFAEDYGFLIEALIELYEATGDEKRWLDRAHALQARQLTLFYDYRAVTGGAADIKSPTASSANGNAQCGAFYLTQMDAPHVLLRIKDAMDAAQPSANSVSVSNLFRLSALLASQDGKTYATHARESVDAFGIEILEHPHLFPGLLCGIVPWKLGGRHWLAVLPEQSKPGAADSATEDDLRTFYKAPRAGLFTLRFARPGEGSVPSEHGVYVCVESEDAQGKSATRYVRVDEGERRDVRGLPATGAASTSSE